MSEHRTVANLASNKPAKLLHHDGRREFQLTRSNRPRSALLTHTSAERNLHGYPADNDPEKAVSFSPYESAKEVQILSDPKSITHVSPAVIVMETHS